MERWSGSVAVVTGASAGIGVAVVQELVKKGLKVVGLARRVERVKEQEGPLHSEPGKLFSIKCDITKEEDIQEAFKWIKANLGGVDILINNAGADSSNTLNGGPVDSWRQILNLNVLGLSICTKLALESMKERGVDGHIIHINSILGHMIAPLEHPFFMYCASKHAVTALTEGLRRELVKLNSKIRITSLSPGLVRTEFLLASGTSALNHETIFDETPCLEGKDIADSIVYILGAPPHVQIHEIIIKPVGEPI